MLIILFFANSNIQEFCGYIKKLPALEAKDGRGRPTFRNLRYDESDSLMTEELRKVLVSLDSGDKAAISPESLFSVIWKVVPRFRCDIQYFVKF
jgi:ubiquitin carboxyl-terminal hydrolase 3